MQQDKTIWKFIVLLNHVSNIPIHLTIHTIRFCRILKPDINQQLQVKASVWLLYYNP